MQWVIIGIIAAAQRNYFGDKVSCATAGTVVVTILAGPLNYVGVKRGSAVQTAFTIAKVLAVALIVVVGFVVGSRLPEHFQQGAATAARWIAHGRVPATRLVLWGGLVPPDAELTRGPQALRGVPLTFVLGSRDHYVSEAALDEDVARMERAGITASVVRFDGGHAVSRAALRQLTGG